MSLGFAIVDAHQHFWDPTRNYHPWLCDEPPIPFRYGDYRALRRPYLPPHYRADAAPFEVSHSVYIETEWDPKDPARRDALRADAAGCTRPAERGRRRRPGSTAPTPPAVLEARSRAALRARGAPQAARARARPAAPSPAAWPMPPGAPASRAWRRWACTSSCRRRGGTCTRRRGWRPTSKARRSC